MYKTSLIFVVFMFSSFFVPSSYAMNCCCGDKDPERTGLTNKTSKEDKKAIARQQKIQYYTQIEQAAKHERQKLEKKQTQGKNGYNPLEEEVDEQEISLGDIVLKLPKTLKVVTNSDDSKSIAYEEIFIQIFKSYEKAIKDNKDVKAMQGEKVELKKHKSLTFRMEELLYKEIIKKSNEENQVIYQTLINCIKNIVEEVLDEELSSIRLVHDIRNRTFAAFLKVKDGAVLIKGLNIDPPKEKS